MKTKFILVAVLVATISSSAMAQTRSITATTAQVENFNSMGSNATATLPTGFQMTAAGNTTVSWNATGNVNATTQAANSGSPTAGGRYNWGNGTVTTDRAIGFMTSGGYASPNSILYGITNNTGSTISSIDLSFDYERFRINSAAASVTFFTSLDGSSWTAATSGDSGAFSTGTSSYTFSGGTVVSKTLSVTGLSLTDGSNFYLRWNFNTTGGNSQGIGLDNVSLTLNPAPATGNFWVGDDTVLGGSGTWTASGGTSWRSTNTDGTGGAFTATDLANFGGVSGGNVTVSGTVAPQNGISLATTGYVISGGTISLAGAASGNNTITTAVGVTGTIDSTLSGSAGLTKSGTGKLIVGGSNTYSGVTTIAQGEFEATSASALGATGSGNGTVVSSGGALNLIGANVGNEALTISGSGLSNGGALRNISGTSSYEGAITLAANSRINSDAGTLNLTSPTAISGAFGLSLGGAGDMTVDGGIASNVTSLTKDGSGTVLLNGANELTGATTISVGVLALGANATLASTSISVAAGASLDVSAKTAGYALGSGVTLNGAGSIETASGQSLAVGSGATIAPGTTTTSATLSVVGGIEFAEGGTYNFTLTSVGGTAGAASGWDLLTASQGLSISATSGSKFTFNINAVGSTGFSNTSNYSWTVATGGSITGFSSDKFSFVNNIAGSNGVFSLSSDATSLILNYAAGTAVPIVWGNTGTATAWYTNSNWTPNTAAAAWTTSDVAQFNNSGTATEAGINMNTASLSIAAIEVTSARTRSLTIGNSSTGSAGTLTLNGATIGSVSNVVVRNASNSLLTLQNTAVSGSQNMTVVLANSTNNVVLIDGAGGVTISSVITGTNSLLTLQGSGSGNLTLSGANTYSGGTTISSRTLIASNASALGTGTVSINGGNLATTISNLNTGNVNLISGELTLNGSGVGTLTLASGADIVWTGGTWNLSILNLGSFDRVLGGGVGSAFAISNTILALSGTVSNGSYEILTGFETGVGSFGSITGLAEGQSAFTNIAGGVLTLTVVPEPHEYALAIAGLLGLLVVVRRVRQSRCLS